MDSNRVIVYVRFIDGTDVLVPVDSERMGNDGIRLLPQSEFDYEDESVLFEFGVGDTVKVKPEQLRDGTAAPVASELIAEGDERNTLKRVLFWMLRDNPDIADITERIGKRRMKEILHHLQVRGSAYPAIRSWLQTNSENIRKMFLS